MTPKGLAPNKDRVLGKAEAMLESGNLLKDVTQNDQVVHLIKSLGGEEPFEWLRKNLRAERQDGTRLGILLRGPRSSERAMQKVVRALVEELFAEMQPIAQKLKRRELTVLREQLVSLEEQVRQLELQAVGEEVAEDAKLQLLEVRYASKLELLKSLARQCQRLQDAKELAPTTITPCDRAIRQH